MGQRAFSGGFQTTAHGKSLHCVLLIMPRMILAKVRQFAKPGCATETNLLRSRDFVDFQMELDSKNVKIESKNGTKNYFINFFGFPTIKFINSPNIS